MIGFTWSLYSTKFEARGIRPINTTRIFCLGSCLEAVINPAELTLLGCRNFKMALLIAVTGGCPALLRQTDKVWGRDVLRTFDHTVDVMTVGVVLLTDDEHRQLMAVTLELGAERLRVQYVCKVAEVLFG